MPLVADVEPIRRMLAHLAADAPVSHGAVTMIPLRLACAAEPDWRTLAEAGTSVTITELDETGSVPFLTVTNASRHPVLLVDGEELIGAKQNRVLNTSVLVARGSAVRIPVSCVEQGRWGVSRTGVRGRRRLAPGGGAGPQGGPGRGIAEAGGGARRRPASGLEGRPRFRAPGGRHHQHNGHAQRLRAAARGPGAGATRARAGPRPGGRHHLRGRPLGRTRCPGLARALRARLGPTLLRVRGGWRTRPSALGTQSVAGDGLAAGGPGQYRDGACRGPRPGIPTGLAARAGCGARRGGSGRAPHGFPRAHRAGPDPLIRYRVGPRDGDGGRRRRGQARGALVMAASDSLMVGVLPASTSRRRRR